MNIKISTEYNRSLKYEVYFAGDICAIFWLLSDAITFATAASRDLENVEYIVNVGENVKCNFINGEEI